MIDAISKWSINNKLIGCSIFILPIVSMVFIIFLSACSSTQPTNDLAPPFERLATVDNFVENGVEVAIVIEKDATEQLFLAFTYSPIYEGYHLYSKDLPEKGINGVGRPTSFEVISPHIFVKSTVIYESIPATTLYIEGFEKPFLVYPEGDVTLRVPITLRRVSEDQIRGDIYVTYMACDNAGTCLAPVVGKNLKMEIPHW